MRIPLELQHEIAGYFGAGATIQDWMNLEYASLKLGFFFEALLGGWLRRQAASSRFWLCRATLEEVLFWSRHVAGG
jgi:hypothetical protein